MKTAEEIIMAVETKETIKLYNDIRQFVKQRNGYTPTNWELLIGKLLIETHRKKIERWASNNAKNITPQKEV